MAEPTESPARLSGDATGDHFPAPVDDIPGTGFTQREHDTLVALVGELVTAAGARRDDRMEVSRLVGFVRAIGLQRAPLPPDLGAVLSVLLECAEKLLTGEYPRTTPDDKRAFAVAMTRARAIAAALPAPRS